MAQYQGNMGRNMQNRSLKHNKVRWINEQTYIDNYGDMHRYDKVKRMYPFYADMIVGLVVKGLNETQIQQAIEEHQNEAVRTHIRLTRIREIIRNEVPLHLLPMSICTQYGR